MSSKPSGGMKKARFRDDQMVGILLEANAVPVSEVE